MNYNKFILENKLKPSVLKVPTDQEIEDAEKILADDVNPDWDSKNGYFIIDVSGKYHVYYTLWRYKPSMTNQYISSMVFITNLSTDFLTAVNKSKKICGRTPIIIDKIGSHQGLFKAQKSQILTFGKYRGSTMGEVFATDPKYLVFMANKYEGGNAERMALFQFYKSLYFENVTKENREKGVSQYVGNIGDEIEKEFTLYKMEHVQGFNAGDPPSNLLKLRDDDKNQYTIYYNKEVSPDTKIGDKIVIKAKIKSHYETLGLKYTRLYYPKKFENKSLNKRNAINRFDL